MEIRFRVLCPGATRIIGFDQRFGFNAKRADLVLVKGAPWQNISDIRNIKAVFVDGQLVAGRGAVLDYLAKNDLPSPKAIGPIGKLRVFAESVGRKFIKGLVLVNRLCPDKV